MTDRPWLKGWGALLRLPQSLRAPAIVAVLGVIVAQEAAVYGGPPGAAPPAPAAAPDPLAPLASVALPGTPASSAIAADAAHWSELALSALAQEGALPPAVDDALATVSGAPPADRAKLAVDAARGVVEARARGMQVSSLAEARALAAAGDWPAVREKAELLWVYGVDEELQQAGLALLVEEQARAWPEDHRGRFLRMVLPKAMRSGRAHRVPPSVTVAQAIVESGWGRSSLTRKHNNLFGVKGGAVKLRTREFRGGKWRRTSASYRSYPSIDESIAHHAEIMNGPHFRRFQPLWADWRAYLRAIAPKYASSPTYVATVAGMVERYGLERFDALTVEGWDRDRQRGG
ncbi:MAG: glucosaminidase domain-containing protein [Deltaproteobacteria bacterium]|nr:glucosaminidase domain-containing protein [Deltaproteobacteria bacterium]